MDKQRNNHIETIVIGKTLVPLWMLLGNDESDDSFKDTLVYDSDRYLPRLLAKYGFSKSASEIKRNRKDLDITLNNPDFLEIKLGKKRINVIVGRDDEIVNKVSKIEITEDDKMEYNLSEDDIDRLKLALEESFKPAIFMKTIDSSSLEEELNLWDSKFGGMPYLEKGDKYPVDENGNPMLLLLQINFGEVPHIEDYPRDGIIQVFFSSNEENGYGMDSSNFYSTKQSSWRIIYKNKVIKDINKLETSSPIDYVEYMEEGSVLPLYCVSKIIFKKGFAPLSPSNPILEGKLMEYNLESLIGENLIYEIINKFGFNSEHMIGGDNNFTQSDPREYNYELRNYDTCLFKIDSDNNMMWGDCGIGNFIIPLEKLKNKDFSDVLYTWDCC